MFIPDHGSRPGSDFFPFRIHLKEFKYFNPKKFTHPGSKRQRIPVPDPQHWLPRWYRSWEWCEPLGTVPGIVILPSCVANFFKFLSDAALTQPWIHYACSLSAERQPNDRNASKNFLYHASAGLAVSWFFLQSLAPSSATVLLNTSSALFLFSKVPYIITGNFHSVLQFKSLVLSLKGLFLMSSRF
jgi:hypothetical protein